MKIFSHSFLPITKLRKDNACYPSKQKRTKRAPTRQRPEKWYKWVSSKWRNLTQIEKTIPFFASSNTDLLNEVARFGVRSKSSGSKSHMTLVNSLQIEITGNLSDYHGHFMGRYHTQILWSITFSACSIKHSIREQVSSFLE